jgi:type II secretory pathway component GspD/PulD (secretin)
MCHPSSVTVGILTPREALRSLVVFHVTGTAGAKVAVTLRRLFAAVTVLVLVTSGLASLPLRAASQTPPARTSLHVSGVPVRDVLARLARAYGASIAVAPDVRGRVTVSFDRRTLDEALAAVLVPLGATWSRANRVVVVTLATSAQPRPSGSPVAPVVLSLQIVHASRAASVLRSLYPRDRIAIDTAANALVVVAPPEDVTAMRAVIEGIDVRDPARPLNEAVQLHNADPVAVAAQLRRIYPATRIASAPNRTLLIEAKPADLAQIKALIAAIDTPPTTPAPTAAPVEAVRVTRAVPRDVARAIANQFHGVRASVAGESVVLGGPPDEVAKAKALVALIDQPASGVRYTQIYRLRFVDARSVSNLLSRSFRDVQLTVDADLNALSVLATPAEQQRIADALAQLDASGGGGFGTGPPVQQPGSAEPGGGGAEVISLRAAAPGLNGAPSSSATDIATTVTQALQGQAPDLRITVPPNGTQLVLTGSPYAIRLAKGLIDQLDVEQKLVVLDTEILEVDETAAKNLGLSFSAPVLTTTLSETTPNAINGGTPPPFLQLQPLTRSPLSFGLNLNLLIQSGKGRVLADPRITTISGRTATIRAGDNIAILTTTGGGTGTVATTQLQTFQTGVTLDITPVVNAGNFITVALHPTVNSLSGVSNGIPQISTRDTQTTVAMREDQTLVIGGLIQDTTTTTTTKIPLLGDLPLIGRAFRNEEYNRQRNELIITVTPHVVSPDAAGVPAAGLPAMPTPQPLPTLPASATLPPLAKVVVPSATRAVSAAPPAPVAQPAVAATRGATPSPVPSAFAATNVFTYGQPPSNNYAGPTDPVQIFYATFAPTVLRNGAPVRFSAVTTTNVSRLTIGYHGFQTQIAQTAPGQWQSSYNFSATGLTSGQTGVALALTATRLDGASSSIQIPVSIVP